MTLHYRITVKGALDVGWSAWFDGLTITQDAHGDSILEGIVRDQTALHGLIARVRDLGLTLVAVVPSAPCMRVREGKDGDD